MKILFKTADRSNLVAQNVIHHLEQRVFEIADCSKMGNPNDFDWVIYAPWMSCEPIPPPQIPKNRGYKVCAYISDLHVHRRFKRTPRKLVKYLNENYDLVLSVYYEMGTEPNFYQENITIPYVFFPPWVETDYYHPSDKPSLYDVVLLGQYDSRRVYPFRFDIARNLRRVASREGWRILLKPAPRGRSAERKLDALYEMGEIVGSRYVETLGRSKVMIGGTSIYKYPLLRYFEGMACKTCVVGDESPMFEKCGIMNALNYWQVSRRTWAQDMKMLLEDDGLRNYLVENAYENIMKNHSALVRAKQMVKLLEEYQ